MRNRNCVRKTRRVICFGFDPNDLNYRQINYNNNKKTYDEMKCKRKFMTNKRNVMKLACNMQIFFVLN